MATVTRNENGTLTVIFRDGYKAEFKQPNEIVLAQCMTNPRGAAFHAIDVLIDQCLLGGDKKLLKDTVAYLLQLQQVGDDVFGKVPCSLTWDEGLATIEFLDGKMMILKPVSRSLLSEAQSKARQNALNGTRHILNYCWHSGDEEIRKSAGHLLGFVEVQEEYMDYTGQKLGN